jgi:hypothetical protein
MFVYRLDEPIDIFDGLVPLDRWLADTTPDRTHWVLTAVLALADAADDITWNGDMRHLPLVGALPTRPQTSPYLVIKQENNGDTFIITDAPPRWIGDTAAHTHVTTRQIGAWNPTDDIPDQPAF